MSEFNSREYWDEIDTIARDLISEEFEWLDKSDLELDEIEEAVMDKINDSGLHERIDSHQWVIYNAYHLSVIEHTNNEDYMADNFGDDCLGANLKDGGLSQLHMAIAFWAMYADVNDKLWDIKDEVFDELLEEHQKRVEA